MTMVAAVLVLLMMVEIRMLAIDPELSTRRGGANVGLPKWTEPWNLRPIAIVRADFEIEIFHVLWGFSFKCVFG